MSLPDLPLPTPGQRNWAQPLNESLEALNNALESIPTDAELEAAVTATETARDQAQTYAANTQELQDSAVAGLITDPDSETATQLSATIGGAIDTSVVNPSALQRVRGELRDAASKMFTVVTLGDSITEGRTATTRENRWATKFAQALADSYGGGTLAEYLPVYYQTPNSLPQPATVTGSPSADSNFGPGQRSYPLTGAQAVEWSVNGSGVDVMYSASTTGGTLQVSVDGVVVGTVNAGGANEDGRVYSYDFGSSGAHTVKVEAAAGTVIVDGIIVYRGSRSAGVRHIDAGHSGWTTNNFQGGGAGGVSFQQWISTVRPSLLTIALGANDFGTGVAIATFRTNLGSIITKSRASGERPDVVLIAMPEREGGGAIPYAQYVTAMREVAAAYGASFLDLNALMGPVVENPSLYADTVHPNDAGHGVIAAHCENLVAQALALVPARQVETVWFPAYTFWPVAGSPAMNGESSAYVGMRFDPTAQEGAAVIARIPAAWTRVNVVLHWYAPTADVGDIAWRVQLTPWLTGQAQGAATFDTTRTISTPGQYRLMQTVFARNVPVDPSGLSKIGVIRMAAASADTFPSDANLAGVELIRAD